MLKLSHLKKGQRIRIGEAEVIIDRIGTKGIDLVIAAPREVVIRRVKGLESGARSQVPGEVRD